MSLEPAAAVASLRETATFDRVGERAVRRLADAHALFGTDMAWVEAELGRATRDGMAPATQSAQHLLDAGGKRVRPLAVLLSAACFGDANALEMRRGEMTGAARELAVVAELVHLATLLHDDVVDDGQERRGQTTSRRVWGNAVSVLAGDLLLTHALERTAAAAPALLGDLVKTLRRLVDGEIVQLRGRTCIDVNESTYFQIVHDKTASLFAWAARAGARAAGAPLSAVTALGDFGVHLGVAFQLVDDALDYAGNHEATGKALFVDLREGKLTLPLLRAIAKHPSLIGDLELARAGDEIASLRLVTAVIDSGACAEVRVRAIDETNRALAALEAVPRGIPRDLLACVATDLAARLG